MIILSWTCDRAGWDSSEDMRASILSSLLLITVSCSNSLETLSAAEPIHSIIPLTRAHAHNDYEHARPLFDALDRGFCSIEPDIWLVDGTLLVAHDQDKVKPDRTLQALYLDPLRERVRKNGGRVYHDGPSVTLLIDVKSDAEKTYAALREVLKDYADVLTAFRDGYIRTNAITVIISGNRALKTMATESVRYAAVDGRIEDLDSNAPSSLIPLISDNWSKVFKWDWSGAMPTDARQRLEKIVAKTHTQGHRLRFWNTPDKPEVWKVLFDAGVDLINTDNLSGLQKFLLSQPAK